MDVISEFPILDGARTGLIALIMLLHFSRETNVFILDASAVKCTPTNKDIISHIFLY